MRAVAGLVLGNRTAVTEFAANFGTNATPSRFTCGGCVSNVKGPLMAVGDHYRAKALELLAHADTERDPQARAELENLAAAYLRLAEQAERNSGLTIEFDLTPGKENPRRKP